MTGWTMLFRAVLPGELASIRYRGLFLNPPGIEWKYFSTDLAGAARYASQAAIAFNEGPFTLVSTSIASTLIADEYRVLVDSAIATVTIPTDLLYALETPTVLEDP